MFTLTSALQYAEAGRIEEWVHLFLNDGAIMFRFQKA